MPSNNIVSALRDRPPRCISKLAPKPLNGIDFSFDGHGEEANTLFCLQCPSGGNEFVVCGYVFGKGGSGANNNQELWSPINVRCRGGQTKFEVFDTSKHGWNAVLCDMSTHPHGKETPLPNEIEARCKSCGNEIFSLIARFEYPNDLLAEPNPEIHGQEEEGFTWFTLVGICSSCKTKNTLADFECA